MATCLARVSLTLTNPVEMQDSSPDLRCFWTWSNEISPVVACCQSPSEYKKTPVDFPTRVSGFLHPPIVAHANDGGALVD
jgi:hypothetical protein